MFAKNLKELRVKNNLTQEELADSLAVSRQAVCMWEKNKRIPKIDRLAEVSKIFEIPIDLMISDDLTFQASDLKKKKLKRKDE